jgi:hypothetical protein
VNSVNLHVGVIAYYSIQYFMIVVLLKECKYSLCKGRMPADDQNISRK